ncbi:hypothetical protein ES332_A08G286700v1 [Gossypium tomentosum]|nr:hypothetical protein ES332_A08G286700v1 [Gossypium tomentosum]
MAIRVVLVNNNNSLIIPYYFTQQFDLDEAITTPENPQAGQEEVAGLVSDMPSVDHAAGNCSVCMESFGKIPDETARRVSCGHVYHHNCITGWLLNGNGNSCPLCRREISSRPMI